MRFIVKTTAIVAIVASLSACQNLSKSQRNTATGIAVGGVAGHVLGGGNNGTTLASAALGGVIGSQLYADRGYKRDDRYYDRRDYKRHSKKRKHRHYDDDDD